MPEEALLTGLVDEILPVEKVLSKSIQTAEALGALPQTPFRLMKRNRVEPVSAQIRQRLREKEHLFLECWFSEEARRRLYEAQKKF